MQLRSFYEKLKFLVVIELTKKNGFSMPYLFVHAVHTRSSWHICVKHYVCVSCVLLFV